MATITGEYMKALSAGVFWFTSCLCLSVDPDELRQTLRSEARLMMQARGAGTHRGSSSAVAHEADV